MISFARQDLILRPIEKRLYLFADERSEGENKYTVNYELDEHISVCIKSAVDKEL